VSLALASLICAASAPALSAAPRQEQAPAEAAPRTPLDPATAELAEKAGEARQAGRLLEAAQIYAEAVRTRPEWTEGLWFLGTLRYELEQYAEALEAFRQLVARERENGLSWAFKGICEYQVGDYERALTDLRRAAALGIADEQVRSVATYHLGILLTRYEDFERALEVLALLVRDGNESPSVTEALGLVLLRLPLLPREVDPRDRQKVMAAGRTGVHWVARRREAAEIGFRELLRRYPTQRNLHYYHGLFQRFEDPDVAIEAFRAELALSSLHVGALLGIALEELKRGRLAEARPLAEKAVELAPGDPVGRHVLGRVFLELGEVPLAIEQLERAVALAPTSPELRFNLARAYARAGREEDAARERAAFVELDRAVKARESGEQSIGGIDPALGETPSGERRRQP
jgi:tetratricopeptide (TPR) repeat protein